MPSMQGIKKIELEHKKLLAEYNAILLALVSTTIGIATLLYMLTKDIKISLIGLILSFLILNSEKESKSNELDLKVIGI